MSFEFDLNNEEQYLELQELLSTFVFEQMTVYSKPHCYEDGVTLSMMEMHTLGKIADSPGLLVTNIARIWNRTLGAATKTVNKLEEKGYVIKKKLPGNNKNIHLYPTAEGERLAKLHKEYDRKGISETIRRLSEVHSPEELTAFLNVLQTLTELNRELM